MRCRSSCSGPTDVSSSRGEARASTTSPAYGRTVAVRILVRGENLIAAAERRVGEELGVSASNLESVGSFTYRASDDVSGLVEYEYDHVVVGTVDGVVSPDPFKVDDVAWVARDRFVSWRPPNGRLAPWADLAHLIALRSLSAYR